MDQFIDAILPSLLVVDQSEPWMSTDKASLPLVVRPLTLDDVDETIAMVNVCEIHDTGEPMWEAADLVADVQSSWFDPALDWVGVFEGGKIVGWAIVVHKRSVWLDVHPAARGRGIGTWLRRWSVDRARRAGFDRIGQSVDDRRVEVASTLLALGYTARRTFWIFRLEHPTRPQEPEPPRGIVLRPFRDEDDPPIFSMFEACFAELGDRVPLSIDGWRAAIVGRPGFAPDDLMVAAQGERIVGGAFFIDSGEVWVEDLAVHRDYRRRGIARALLQTAHRRAFDRGYRQTRLSTDANGNARAFYERIGMKVHRSLTHFALDLGTRPG
jgi:GNAT superfamily N-acetyltransferase